jgi:hypothetical protein
MQRSEPSVSTILAEAGLSPAEVREQLERIVSSPLLRNSKRYPSLLRHVVEQALDGRSQDLKERTLGIEVFGRSPDYDTNVDPVVRISAAEIRKRIAQYYHEPGHEDEIRIELPLGSYVPEFRLPPERQERQATTVAAPVAAPVLPAEPVPVPAPVETAVTTVPRRRVLPILLAAGLAIVVAIVLFSLKPWASETALDRFWNPMLVRDKSVLLCIGRIHDPDGRPHGVALSDSTTMARLSGLLQAKGQPWTIRAEDQATFADMRQGPAVLIGAFNDSWNLRLASSLRYTFHQESGTDWIEDQQSPSDRKWSVTVVAGGPPVAKDFALITRIIDPNTDRIMVAVGGLLGYGTLAAGEFLTDNKYMESFAAQAPQDWPKKNLQIVLSTEVIKGNSGPPKVVASYAW